jgi:hypothetical protein
MRIDSQQLPTSVLSFVGKHSDKHRPSRIVNGLGEVGPRQSLHVQIFDGNHAVFVNQVPRLLVQKIAALIQDVSMSALEFAHSFAAAMTALLPARHLALCAAQPRLRIAVVTRILDFRTIGKDREAGQTEINPGCMRTGRQWLDFAFDTEDGEPSTCLTFHRYGLDPAFNGTVQLDLDFTGALDTKQVAGQFAAIAIRRKSDRVSGSWL